MAPSCWLAGSGWHQVAGLAGLGWLLRMAPAGLGWCWLLVGRFGMVQDVGWIRERD